MISTRNVLVSAASLVAVAQALTVNTPASAVQCQPVALSWGDGSAPFYVSIIPGGQPSAAALENIPTQSGTSYTWMVDIDAGTSITVKVVDSTGAVNYSDQVTIQQGTTTDCSASSASSGDSTPAAAAGSSSASSSASRAASSAGSSSAALASGRSPLSSSAAAGSSSAAARTTGAAASSGVSSGVGANAAASTSATGAAKMGASVGFSLLGAGLLFALAA
ncbi:hypothetical protein P389DRAFT_167214 [Cystobasidium minutum MCA 4210]|uniref:uncharacterized protein n=1 Tax=Cystobasidium minutum MCA 4210 TaxID=1397322 RepID=UPI0034CF355F|eukprot:jgi/Rhomi1/167214/fgenesh1_kg.2_\